jgi:glycosyltransferase involved in cell wall biosynthesis
MPCRDAAAHLPDAIASLEAQTFVDFEVIAVEDGSSDDTDAILGAWSARDARVRVLRRPARGIVPSLVTAHAAARAALLGRMDADDVAHPERFARQVELLDRRSDVVACGTGVRYVPAGLVRDGARRYAAWLNACVDPADIDRDIFVECPIAHPTLIVRRDAFEAQRPAGDVGIGGGDLCSAREPRVRHGAVGCAQSRVPQPNHIRSGDGDQRARMVGHHGRPRGLRQRFQAQPPRQLDDR